MKTIARILGLILLMLFIAGCRSISIAPIIETTPDILLAPTTSPSPNNFHSPASTAVLISTNAVSATKSKVMNPAGVPTALTEFITPGLCSLIAVTQPPPPTETFSTGEADPETGLHVTGRPLVIELSTYRLKVTGLVDHPLSLTYDELRCMPKVTDNPDLVCPGVFTDHASWTGVPITYILDLAGVQQGATKITLVSADGYEEKLLLETAATENNFLAYEVNGKTLPVLHGFPLRAVFPSLWGSTWVKWLVEIRIS